MGRGAWHQLAAGLDCQVKSLNLILKKPRAIGVCRKELEIFTPQTTVFYIPCCENWMTLGGWGWRQGMLQLFPSTWGSESDPQHHKLLTMAVLLTCEAVASVRRWSGSTSPTAEVSVFLVNLNKTNSMPPYAWTVSSNTHAWVFKIFSHYFPRDRN